LTENAESQRARRFSFFAVFPRISANSALDGARPISRETIQSPKANVRFPFECSTFRAKPLRCSDCVLSPSYRSVLSRRGRSRPPFLPKIWEICPDLPCGLGEHRAQCPHAFAVCFGDFSRSGFALIGRVTSCQAAASVFEGVIGAGGSQSLAGLLSGLAGAGASALGGLTALGNLSAANDQFQNGDILGGLLSSIQAGVDLYTAAQACFTGEMPNRTLRGDVLWRDLRVGDFVRAGNEHDPKGELTWKQVLAIFIDYARIWHLDAGGRTIRTTARHPFFVWGKGWVSCSQLQPGDLLRAEDGRMIAVQSVYDSGVEEKVYNCVVEDYHTYFVGSAEWGFAVWAHNTCQGRDEEGKFLSKNAGETAPGRAFEEDALAAAGLKKNTKTFKSQTNNGDAYNTIPDAINPKNGKLVEVKSGQNVSLDGQLQAQVNVGKGVELIVAPGADVSTPALNAVGGVKNIQVYNPGTGTLTPYIPRP
jgi:hypothetical protein